MAKHQLHDDVTMLEAYKRLGSKKAAAEELGLSRSTLQHHLRRLAPDGEPATDPAKTVTVKPRFRIQQRGVRPEDDKLILAIGDTHDSPHIADKSRFEALGRLAYKHKVDQIVQIGDFTSLDSMSFHEGNETLKGRQKPSFMEDMKSMQEALKAFRRGLNGHQCPMHITLGNHEHRLFRYVNQNPEIAELLDGILFAPLDDYGWTYSPYGEFYFVGDVGFVHAPMNVMGKPYGGANCEAAIARDALHDIVFGHTHKRTDKSFPKMGNEHITVINLGCALPAGHLEDYARHSLTGWSYGAYLLNIRGGRIAGQSWVPMSSI